ncbi:MAG: glycoside hydrolase family 127 protein [Promethearchaeota archaeon]
MEQVEIIDNFWTPRIRTNTKITIPHVIQKCEETGRLANFSRAAGILNDGKGPIFQFDDSDVFKTVEGAAYSLLMTPDPELEAFLDDLIDKMATAQEEDGYMYTARTIDPDNPHKWAGKKRWDLVSVLSHELYNMGHLIEAGITYFQVTGKRKLLEIAINSADLICREFGRGKIEKIPGHQEIEIALIRLYRITNKTKYLELARFFLDIRGTTKKFDFKNYSAKTKIFFEDSQPLEYAQSHKKVIDQNEAVGHAVRAGYMYTAMTDVAAIYNDIDYKRSIGNIWDNVVSKKLYITGGIGAHGKAESFGNNYELPNSKAYAETCAAIANILWNHRLFLLYGDTKYIDVLERTLYNGFLSGISLEGNKFFYVNPLASSGKIRRRSWWVCPCCPTNIVRFIPQIPKYIYGIKNDTIFINLFIGNKATLLLNDNKISLNLKTDYPWDGIAKVEVTLPKPTDFILAIRIPGWARNRPVPSDLYYYLNTIESEISLKINNIPINVQIEKGYINIKRIWNNNDSIELNIPMPIRRILSHNNVNQNIGKVAIERGPLVYCIESIDINVDSILNLHFKDIADYESEFRRDLLNGITTITGSAYYYKKDKEMSSLEKRDQNFLAIPYYSWSNRDRSEMTLWVEREGKEIKDL